MDTQFSARSLIFGFAIALTLTLFPAGSAHADRLLAPKHACPAQSDATAPPETQEAAMRCLHKYARRKAGRRGVRMNTTLQSTAAAKAHDMVTCNTFGHDACGRPSSYWFNAMGYLNGCSGFAENLSMGAATPRDAMRAFLSSAPHRADLLGRRYRDIGAAVEGGYWVVHLGYHC